MKFALSQEHEVVTLDPSRGAIGDDVDALVIAGPRQPFDAAARGAIGDFVRRGKSAIFLLDGRTEPRGNDAGRPIDTGLEPAAGRLRLRDSSLSWCWTRRTRRDRSATVTAR